MNIMLYWYLIIINFITFLVFALDKRKAKKGKWRIRVQTLLGLSFLGGAAGGLVAMYTFRHKTKQKIFKFGLPVLLVLQMMLLFLFRVQ